MNIFTFVFQEALYRPLLNLLMVFYNLPYVDLGIAILITTAVIRLVLWPLHSKAIISQRDTQVKSQHMQEKIKEIKEKYKDDPTSQSAEMMNFFKKNKFNPFSGIMPMVVQIIVLIAFYQALRIILEPAGLDLLYGFVESPGSVSPMFFRTIDLSKAIPVLAILTGIAQYFHSKITFQAQAKKKKQKSKKEKAKQISKKQDGQMENMQKMMQKQMLYFMPMFTVFIGWVLPATLILYWLFSTLIGIVQQKIIFNKER